MEILWQILAEKDNARLDRGSLLAMSASKNHLVTNRLLQSLEACRFLAARAVSSSVCTMRLHNAPHIQTSFLLEVVDVLGHVLPQNALVLQHLDKVVSWGGLMRRGVKMLRKVVKCLRSIQKVSKLKQGFRVWKVVLCQVCVDSSLRRAEVGNACRN